VHIVADSLIPTQNLICESARTYLHKIRQCYITGRSVNTKGKVTPIISGPGISVGIATGYELQGPGSNLGGGLDIPPFQTGPRVHLASCKMGTGSSQGVKCGRGVLLTTHPLLVPRS
jgi:hypothetical protein